MMSCDASKTWGPEGAVTYQVNQGSTQTDGNPMIGLVGPRFWFWFTS